MEAGILMAESTQAFQWLEYPSARLSMSHKQEVRLVLLDPCSYLLQCEAGAGGGGDLLHSGAPPPRHVSRPDTPDTIVSYQDSFAWLQHVGHHALHGSMPRGRECEAHGVLSLEDILHTSLHVVHDLGKLWVQMSQSRQGLSLKDPVRYIRWSRTCQGLQRDMYGGGQGGG